MKTLLKRFWAFMNAPRLLEIENGKFKYYMLDERYQKPIIENIEEPVFKTPFLESAKQDFLAENEYNSICLCRQYILKTYENQGLLPTKKQLENDTLTMWENYKASNLVDDYLRLKDGVKEGITDFILQKSS